MSLASEVFVVFLFASYASSCPTSTPAPSPTYYKYCRDLTDNIIKCRANASDCTVGSWDSMSGSSTYSTAADCEQAIPTEAYICSTLNNTDDAYCRCVSNRTGYCTPPKSTARLVNVKSATQCFNMCVFNSKTTKCEVDANGDGTSETCLCIKSGSDAGYCAKTTETGSQTACTAACTQFYS